MQFSLLTAAFFSCSMFHFPSFRKIYVNNLLVTLLVSAAPITPPAMALEAREVLVSI
jgi:hypothetical protein